MLPDGPRVCGGEHRLRVYKEGQWMYSNSDNQNLRCYDYISQNKTWKDAGIRSIEAIEEAGVSRCGTAQNIVFNTDEMPIMHCLNAMEVHYGYVGAERWYKIFKTESGVPFETWGGDPETDKNRDVWTRIGENNFSRKGQ